MSGIAKGVGKVFKSVAKVAKKVAPFALAAGAIILTAGAALPALAPLSAGLTSITGSMGAGSFISTILTGAVQKAAVGAVLGGVTSAVTGGDIGKGILMGAAGGAITGGFQAAMSAPATAATAAAGAPAAAGGAGVAPVTVTDLPAISASAPSAGVSAGAGAAPAVAGTPAAVGAAADAGGNGMLSGLFEKGGFIERNQDLIGGVVKGVGQGVMAKAQAEDEAEALMKRDQMKRDSISANYDTGGRGLLSAQSPMTTSGAGRPTPEQRFQPSVYSGAGSFQYDPNSRRVVWVAG